MRERNRSARSWHTAEPRHLQAEGVSQDGAAEDGFFADESARRAASEAFQDELPPGSGYGVGGEGTFDPTVRKGARGNRAERSTGEDESSSHARPRRPRGPQDPEWRIAGGSGGWGRTRPAGKDRGGHDWGAHGWGGQAPPQPSGEWDAPGSSGREDPGAPGPHSSPGFGWGGAPTAYGEWGGLESGPYRADPGRGGYGGQWGSPAGSRQGGREWRDEWNREHSMRGGEPWTVPGPHTGRGPQGYERSDKAILEDVCERLTRHGEVDASDIKVRCEGREVILEGTVDDRRSKRLAEDTAESVTGVRDVQNRLRIRDREDSRAAADEHGEPREPETARHRRRRK